MIVDVEKARRLYRRRMCPEHRVGLSDGTYYETPHLRFYCPYCEWELLDPFTRDWRRLSA